MRCAVALTLGGLLAIVGEALAEPTERGIVAAELYRYNFDRVGRGEVDEIVWVAALAGDVHIAGPVSGTAAWAMTRAEAPEAGSLGNPSLGAHVALPHRVRVGVDATVPLVSAAGHDERANLQAAAVARGNWDAWRWFPDWMTVVAPVRWKPLRGRTAITVDAAAGITWEVRGEHARFTSALVAQLGVEVAYQATPRWSAEARAAVTTARNADDSDENGLIEAGAACRLGDGELYLRVGRPFETDTVNAPIAALAGARWSLW